MQRFQTKTVKGKSQRINRKWAHEDLVTLHRLNTDLTRAVDFWVESTLEGYIVEFAAECYQYFSREEGTFRSGLRGKLLKEIPLWIKALMVDEGLMVFQKARMEV